MFQKVLIAEDHETINYSIQKTLEDLGIPNHSKNYAYYCDDAIKRIEKALKEGEPYELLITDLSFEEDIPNQHITTGQDLIKAARKIQPNLKVLVFSIENRIKVAQSLFKDLNIDAYVPKARRDAKDLKTAIETIYQAKKHLSPNLKKDIGEEKFYKFTNFDIIIIKLLSNGVLQKEIPYHLQQKNIKPSGLSSVEKRLSLIKTTLNIFSNEQLIAYCKDKEII
ncbi:DNA-binding transcriptional response regulator [Pedobacter ureilyticus]|uniref:Response regulator transcription factor n=1 Tax=Pedobacter ureilyticus TaxID=1393051 RepID=A0ABW9J1N2_9SPHI|nr:response regulator transcription factor [Pedobacter helvus]